MTTYSVFYSTGMNRATIALEGYEPTTDTGELVGTFEMDVNPINGQIATSDLASHNGDHPFINKARELMRDEGFPGDLDRVTFVDKASSAPVHDENVGTTDQMDVSENGQHPNISSQAGGEGSAVGTNPAATESNGQQPAKERDDKGEQSDTSDKGDHTTETVAALKERIAKITDKDELQKEFDKENAGAKRSTAVAAFEARAAELQSA